MHDWSWTTISSGSWIGALLNILSSSPAEQIGTVGTRNQHLTINVHFVVVKEIMILLSKVYLYFLGKLDWTNR